MRSIVLVVPALLALSACAEPTPGTLAWRATLDAPTRGIGLHRDGTTGHGGMYGTNCPFETERGAVTGDQQLPGEGEQVQDVGSSSLGDDSVVLVLDDTIFVLDKGTGEYEQDEFPVEGAREGRFADAGLVTLRGDAEGCAIDWYAGHTITATTRLASCPEGTQFDVLPASGMAAIVSPDGVALATPAGVVATTEAGSLVSWDLETEAVYVAEVGGSRVTALAADGTTLWGADVDGVITALDAAGTPGGAAIAVSRPDGAGALLLLDAATGGLVAEVATPLAAMGVETSPDGSTVALVRPDAVHFYELTR